MITREQMVAQSTQDFITERLAAAGYGPTIVQVREAFPTIEERMTPLTVTQVALGFNFDDGGKKVELGSDLTLRVYNVEFWVFGTTQNRAENVSGVIRAVIEDNDLLIPLKDISVAGHPVIDQLTVLDDRGIRTVRQIAPDPRPWDANVYTTTVRVEDYYSPALVN
jgi:hypothetical protein